MCQDCGWKAFVKSAHECLSDIDELPERVEDYADSVRERVDGMLAWAKDHEHVTEKMDCALENIHEGVLKWSR